MQSFCSNENYLRPLQGRRLPPQTTSCSTDNRSCKEALFNILHHRFEWNEIRTLDLFAGTGNISYELASRGVNDLTAIDQNKYCVYYINQTAKALEMPIAAKNNVEKFEYPTLPYDFIFADPPYAFKREQLIELVNQLINLHWVKTTGLIVVEHDKHITLSEHEYFLEERTMVVVFSFFKG